VILVGDQYMLNVHCKRQATIENPITSEVRARS
jgi:hypothetical protein